MLPIIKEERSVETTQTKDGGVAQSGGYTVSIDMEFLESRDDVVYNMLHYAIHTNDSYDLTVTLLGETAWNSYDNGQQSEIRINGQAMGSLYNLNGEEIPSFTMKPNIPVHMMKRGDKIYLSASFVNPPRVLSSGEFGNGYYLTSNSIRLERRGDMVFLTGAAQLNSVPAITNWFPNSIPWFFRPLYDVEIPAASATYNNPIRVKFTTNGEAIFQQPFNGGWIAFGGFSWVAKHK